jgi:hypothetical protein
MIFFFGLGFCFKIIAVNSSFITCDNVL